MRKSHYIENGIYLDVTTGQEYMPKDYCELCGKHFMLGVHHYLSQNKCLRDIKTKKISHPGIWTQEFVDKNQKLFTLCNWCHTDIHNMSDEHFYNKYHIERKNYVYKNK